MKVGLLTGGGDCPGLNAVIRAVTRRVTDAGGACVGVQEGWRGLVRGMFQPLEPATVEASLGRGGTILGSSRTNPYKSPDADIPRLRRNFAAAGLDALVVVGGDDTLGVAARLINDFELPIVGVPKTIDNDLMLADFSFGFDTAVNVVVEAVERLRTTAESHRRIMVVETMGRSTGWLACFAGMAVGADYILVPEIPIDVPHLVAALKRQQGSAKNHAILVVAEGARYSDASPAVLESEDFGHPRLGGVGALIANVINRQLRVETRTVVLGHLQRGGAPTAHDRVLATRLGLAAAELVLRRRFGTVLTLRGAQIADVPLDSSALANRSLDLAFYQDAAAFFY
ncbi:6-phosphofructokinase [Paludisphaera mucosa]|uniref:Pyrophosphate--fructose 6-phosphate 1-phosphotransferase n=1 Tax=Paludisphaera mucosa TaxID=3030827 RepID=A0ABT6FIA1_9BACT|nr:ATP-dependent 6-phosphofructokinase [Paludisphaera mucosa]MDG3007296.1 ATP-dependent 6-phosphofructokinase [Paludisphaera mucosa]